MVMMKRGVRVAWSMKEGLEYFLSVCWLDEQHSFIAAENLSSLDEIQNRFKIYQYTTPKRNPTYAYLYVM